MTGEWEQLINEMKKGSIRALAGLITRIENRKKGWLEAMQAIYPDTGGAHVIGITGAPGAGKSTLTDKLTRKLVDTGNSVGVIAVDPSSPFSGGALLGDRLRMKEISNLEGVFVRSMATRGALGGLSMAARDIVKVMDAFGKDIVIIETVGVGQDEVEVVKTADHVMVICVPGLGDGIQAIKAGIMEIADIFVVNKSDLDGADQVVADIRAMLDMSTEKSEIKIPVRKTIAASGEGVQELVDTFFKLVKSGKSKTEWQDRRVRDELFDMLVKEIARHIRDRWSQDGKLDDAVLKVIHREKDPYSIIQELFPYFVNTQ